MSFSITGSNLTTERLILQPWPAEDVVAARDGVHLAHWAPDFPAEGDSFIAGFIAENPHAHHRYGQRQIVERESGLVVGSIGVFWPPSERTVEFGYGVVPSRRGRGFATEATEAIVAFALTSEEVDHVCAQADVSNPASVRVLERAGLQLWSREENTVRYGTARVKT